MNHQIKADLHLHFDGSLPMEEAWKLVEKTGCNHEDFIKSMQVDQNCHSLYDYLARFDTPLKLLQTEENLYKMAYALIKELDSQKLAYAEIRFAPMQHIKSGLSQCQVVRIMCQARKDAMLTSKIHVNYILCMMVLGEEKLTHDLNVETIQLAHEFSDQGVVAIDLAGAEGLAPMQDFQGLFQMAKELGLRYTIHAGESYGPENIAKAIEFGAERIGHGTSAIKDPLVMKLLKEKKIPLEVCVTSNVNCEVVDHYESHPIRQYIDAGIIVLICTDNMTISNTNLDREYEKLMRYCGITAKEIEECQLNAIRYSFADPLLKEQLINHKEMDSVFTRI